MIPEMASLVHKNASTNGYEHRISIWRNRLLDCVAVTIITNRSPNRGTVFYYYWHLVFIIRKAVHIVQVTGRYPCRGHTPLGMAHRTLG